jgi:hypothetical protein
MDANYNRCDFDFDELKNYINDISKYALTLSYINVYGKQEVFRRVGGILKSRGFTEEEFEDPKFVLYHEPKNTLPIPERIKTAGQLVDLYHERSTLYADGFFKTVKIVDVSGNYFSVEHDDIHFGYPMRFYNVNGKLVSRMYAKMLELQALPLDQQPDYSYHVGGVVAFA